MSNIIHTSSRPWFIATDNIVVDSVTGDGSVYDPIFNAASGSGYNTTTGQYTSSMAGWYQFSINIDCGNIQAAMTLGTYFLITTNQTYQFSDFNPAATKGPAGSCMAAASVLTFLAKGNVAWPQIKIFNSAKVANWNGTSSFFSGVRLY